MTTTNLNKATNPAWGQHHREANRGDVAGAHALRRTVKPVPIPARPTLPALHGSLRFAESRSVPSVVVDLSCA